MQAIQFIKTYSDAIIMAIIILFVFVLFIRDFDYKSRRSWLILFGISALGAAVFYRTISRNKLLKELEEREKKLKELEKKYEEMKKNNEITKENYEIAKKKLEEAKKKAAEDILTADENLKKELEELDKDHENITSDELLDITKKILNTP